MLLFIVLWWYSSRPRSAGTVSGLFLMGYAILRFTAEFAREPDAFLGLLALGLSMGQLLCIPMFVAGALLFGWAWRRPPDESPGYASTSGYEQETNKETAR